MGRITQTQIDNIQLDYGLVYLNYGEDDQAYVGLTQEGAEFTATAEIRDIEFDGRRGKTAGLRTIDAQDAMIKTSLLASDLATLDKVMANVKKASETKIQNAAFGVIPASKNLENVTVFGRTIGGKYKKITIYNALGDNGITIAMKDKAEGVVPVEISGHLDPLTDIESAVLWEMEDVDAIEPAPGA